MKLHRAAALIWLLVTPPNPPHLTCPTLNHLLPGPVRVGVHIASGEFAGWQLWSAYTDEHSCQKDKERWIAKMKELPQNAGCGSLLLSGFKCISSEGARIREKN
jgi:hypothetical protein